MMIPDPQTDKEKAEAAYFSSPYSSSSGSPLSSSNDSETSISPSRTESGLPPAERPTLASRLRYLGTRASQRRLVWVAIFFTAALLIYNHDQSSWMRSVRVSAPQSHPPPASVVPAIPEAHDHHADGEWHPESDDSTITPVENPADADADAEVETPSAAETATPTPTETDIDEPPEIEYGPANLPFDDSLAHLKQLDPTIPKPKEYSPFYGGSSKRPIDIASDPLPLSASLKERLAVWRAAPGGRGEVPGEVELGGFMQFNLEECSTIEHSHNTHMIQVGATVWASFNRSSLHRERERLITYLETLDGTPALQNTGTGRGIVMQAGNADTLRRAVWSISFMRARGSALPVQIYCFPEELPPADDAIYQTLKELDAELVAAQGQTKDVGKSKSYHLKAIAMIENPFREVLYLDSDSIPTRDPEYMFDAPSYRRLGIFATPDYWKTSASNPIWAIMGVKCRGEWEMETGQMFINKEQHLDVLWLVRYMLEHHADEDDWPGYFRYSDGDKDIFRWAMLMLRKRWGVPGRWVSGGALPRDNPTGFCSHTMLQNDAWGEPLFVHYNLLKQIPSGVYKGFCWGRHKQMPLFNTFPAAPEVARLGEPVLRPNDTMFRGLGDVDCDMLADADEYGVARAPAREMIMRRAARERGIKVIYHGGVVSALCIDFQYTDPRPAPRRKSEKEQQSAAQEAQSKLTKQWEAEAAAAKDHERPIPPRPQMQDDTVVLPSWKAPYEVVGWQSDSHLANFENDLFGLGFVPNGRGF